MPHDPRHRGVPSSASKTISKPMVLSTQTVHLSCTDGNTITKGKEVKFHMPTSPKSSIGCVQNDFCAHGMFEANRAPLLHQD
jgi:hypothetical protein